MRNRLDLKDHYFGRLKVLSAARDRVRDSGRHVTRWNCRCECGTRLIVLTDSLMSGHTASCGCLSREESARRRITHGLSHAGCRAYTCWAKMRERILSPSCKSFKNYGGRGIKICQRWGIFLNFYADMGDPPPGMSIHRKNNDGDYTPKNCKWATRKEQGRSKRNLRLIRHDGATRCLAEWSEITGLKAATISSRLKKGWPIAIALTMPI